mmetsp:Transcript_26953/g.30637  ORF Transcript_26953/g.30637 Transcript_26953/m.30637 type:complete len:241 (-) Transcript_26953:124-846(-)
MGITEIIFTGHSLGGACAQVGHVMIAGQRDEVKSSVWMDIKGPITLRTASFEGNTSILFKRTRSNFLVNIANIKGKEFLRKIGATSSTTVYSNDVVPRLNNQLGFAFQVIENLVENNFGKIGDFAKFSVAVVFPWLLIPFYKNLEAEIGIIKAIAPYVIVAKGFDHVGQAIYYSDPEAFPVVYKNFDELNKNVKYKKTAGSVISRLIEEHEFIVGKSFLGKEYGPGLAWGTTIPDDDPIQ